MKIDQTLVESKPKVIINAVAGWGKTTTASYAPAPVMIMTNDERGYYTLANRGAVPSIDAGMVSDWDDLLNTIQKEITPSKKWKTLIIEAAGGIERLAHEKVCKEFFDGDWGEKGFMGYMRGYRIAQSEIRKLVQVLDECNMAGKMIIMTSHPVIRTFNNPAGADYDRYICDLNEKTYTILERWVDAVLFGTYETLVKKDQGKDKGKGVAGYERVVYCTRADAWEAKNRYSMPSVIKLPDDPSQMFTNIFGYMAKQPQEAK